MRSIVASGLREGRETDSLACLPPRTRLTKSPLLATLPASKRQGDGSIYEGADCPNMREDLSDEDVNRLNSVRKQIWAAGYTGFFLGGAWGLANCVIYKALQAKAVEHFPKQSAIKSLPVLQNKHYVMCTLVAGATGMFLGAGMGGIRGNEDLRDIYDRRTGGGLTEQQETPALPSHLPRDAPEHHVAKASADSHARRMEAIRLKREQDNAESDGTSKSGKFKAW